MASQDQSYKHKGQAHEEKSKDQSPEMDQTTAGKKKGGGGGVIQRTGEQVKSMAQGAADKMKQSFGMAEEEEDDEVAAAVGAKTAAGRTNY